MQPTVLFIHGMFLTGKCWENWTTLFERRGFECVSPSWPLHQDEPSVLRTTIPAGLGELGLAELIETFADTASTLPAKPVLVGHSIGGLIAQQLVARGLATAAVCIGSVAPNAMLSFDWG